MVVTAKHLRLRKVISDDGVKAITVPDERWARRDIKTIQLLANCRAKQRAAEQGAYEAIMVMPDGTVSEGSVSNVWILTEDGELVTRKAVLLLKPVAEAAQRKRPRAARRCEAVDHAARGAPPAALARARQQRDSRPSPV